MRDKKDIVDLAIQLHSEGVDLQQEDNAAGFLGVHIECNHMTGFLKILQKGLIKQVSKTLDPDDGTENENFTPVKGKIFPNTCTESLLLVISTTAVYLEHSCILLDTHAPTLLMLSIVLQDIYVLPKACAWKCPEANCCDLKATSEKGLIIKPSNKLLMIGVFLMPILL